MVSAAKAAFGLQAIKKPLLICEYEIQQSTSPLLMFWFGAVQYCGGLRRSAGAILCNERAANMG